MVHFDPVPKRTTLLPDPVAELSAIGSTHPERTHSQIFSAILNVEALDTTAA